MIAKHDPQDAAPVNKNCILRDCIGNAADAALTWLNGAPATMAASHDRIIFPQNMSKSRSSVSEAQTRV
jgi:hypothetical protein